MINFYNLIIIFLTFSIYGANTQTVRWSYGHYFTHNNVSLNFQVTVTTPSTPGTYPVIFFLTGFDGLCPTEFYNQFLTDIVAGKNNAIVVSFDKFQFIKLPDHEENIFEITLNWAIENLNGIFNSTNTPDSVKNKVFPDNGPNGYTIMSHSSGGHPVCLYLKKNCGQIKKLVLLDPVDGFDPFGIVKSYCTSPPNQLPFKIPTLIISTGLDPIPVISISSACAPNNISNNRFYESLAGPTFYFNFTDYGHADILEEWVRKNFAAYVCTACDHKHKDCDFDTYRANLANAIMYFVKAVDEKNQNYLNAIVNPENSGMFNSNIKITSKLKYNGYDILKSGAFCEHN